MRDDPKSILVRSKLSLHHESAGGEPYLMRALVRALADSGWRVDVICPAPENRPASSDLPAEFTEFGYTTPDSMADRLADAVRGTSEFRRLVARKEFDVFLDSVANLPFYPAHYLTPAETTNAMYIHSFLGSHASELLSPGMATGHSVVERSLPHLSAPEMICNGPSTERRVRKTTGTERTHVLRPCIPTDEFTYTFDPESDTIVYLGRLSREKNVEWLLRAWSHVEASTATAELKIIGTGPHERELRDLCAELGLARVEFVGYKSGEEKRRLLRDALLLVFPSSIEGYGIAGLEALASGTPVVAGDVPGISDYVDSGESGYLVEFDDERALAETLIGSLRDTESVRPLAEGGLRVAEAHSFQVFRDRADSLFTRLAEQTR